MRQKKGEDKEVWKDAEVPGCGHTPAQKQTSNSGFIIIKCCGNEQGLLTLFGMNEYHIKTRVFSG